MKSKKETWHSRLTIWVISILLNSAQNPSTPGNRECDLFMNWLANNLTAPEKYDIRVAMPVVYRKFDQYLTAMRRQLNHN